MRTEVRKVLFFTKKKVRFVKKGRKVRFRGNDEKNSRLVSFAQRATPDNPPRGAGATAREGEREIASSHMQSPVARASYARSLLGHG